MGDCLPVVLGFPAKVKQQKPWVAFFFGRGSIQPTGLVVGSFSIPLHSKIRLLSLGQVELSTEARVATSMRLKTRNHPPSFPRRPPSKTFKRFHWQPLCSLVCNAIKPISWFGMRLAEVTLPSDIVTPGPGKFHWSQLPRPTCSAFLRLPEKHCLGST